MTPALVLVTVATRLAAANPPPAATDFYLRLANPERVEVLQGEYMSAFRDSDERLNLLVVPIGVPDDQLPAIVASFDGIHERNQAVLVLSDLERARQRAKHEPGRSVIVIVGDGAGMERWDDATKALLDAHVEVYVVGVHPGLKAAYRFGKLGILGNNVGAKTWADVPAEVHKIGAEIVSVYTVAFPEPSGTLGTQAQLSVLVRDEHQAARVLRYPEYLTRAPVAKAALAIPVSIDGHMGWRLALIAGELLAIVTAFVTVCVRRRRRMDW